MTGGRKGTVFSLATVFGWGGALLRWGAVYMETLWVSYWQYLVAYICVFGVIGYFTTFYALSGGALAPCVTHPIYGAKIPAPSWRQHATRPGMEFAGRSQRR
jgi:hypothetical protein